MARYVFITGGVVSSLGKGLASAALGALLQARGYKVRLRKLDPYLNVDPGTMSPYQHGEVFVTDDGAETDLDLGHYERFTGNPANKQDNITTGRIYQDIIARERRGSARTCRLGGRCRRSAGILQDRARLAVPARQDREQQTGGEENRCENCGGARQHVRGAAAGQEAASAAAHAKPAAFRFLQQHEANHGGNDHQVDDNNDGLHSAGPKAYGASALKPVI